MKIKINKKQVFDILSEYPHAIEKESPDSIEKDFLEKVHAEISRQNSEHFKKSLLNAYYGKKDNASICDSLIFMIR